jgi:hypothetical protein
MSGWAGPVDHTTHTQTHFHPTHRTTPHQTLNRPAPPPKKNKNETATPRRSAIEMSGFLELKCEILRGGMEQYLTPMGPTKLHVNPIFETGPLEPRYAEYLVFEGLSVDETGKQHYLDATVRLA